MTTAGLEIHGICDPRFAAVREAFAENFTRHGEVGASLAITIEGRTVAGEKVIANIRFWVDGHRPPDQVLEGWA